MPPRRTVRGGNTTQPTVSNRVAASSFRGARGKEEKEKVTARPSKKNKRSRSELDDESRTAKAARARHTAASLKTPAPTLILSMNADTALPRLEAQLEGLDGCPDSDSEAKATIARTRQSVLRLSADFTAIALQTPSPPPKPLHVQKVRRAAIVSVAVALRVARSLRTRGQAGDSNSGAVSTAAGGWECDACTLVNAPTRRICAVCRAKRPLAVAAVSRAASRTTRSTGGRAADEPMKRARR